MNNITLTDEQEELVQRVIEWFNDPYSPQTFEYKFLKEVLNE
jgi:hypothetical protein